MNFGTELPLLLALGFVVLGPKRMHATLRHMARAKAELDEAICGIKSQLPAEAKGALQDGRNDDETPSGARHREDGLGRGEVRSRQ
jgi:Sec-independent protein translocase protein TatA